jgi:hypothetical protein
MPRCIVWALESLVHLGCRQQAVRCTPSVRSSVSHPGYRCLGRLVDVDVVVRVLPWWGRLPAAGVERVQSSAPEAECARLTTGFCPLQLSGLTPLASHYRYAA